MLDERRLAASRGAEDDPDFLRSHGQGHPLQHLAVAIVGDEIPDLDHWLTGRRLLRWRRQRRLGFRVHAPES